MKESISAPQGQSDAALLPCGVHGLALSEGLDEPGQLCGGKTAAHEYIAQTNARRPPASCPVRTVRITENPPCPDALFTLGYVSANVAVTDQRTARTAEWTAQRVQQFQKPFDSLPALEESLHPQQNTAGSGRAKQEPTRGSIRLARNESPEGGAATLQNKALLPNSGGTTCSLNSVAIHAALRYKDGK